MLDLFFMNSLNELPVNAVAINNGLEVAENHKNRERRCTD